MVEQFKLDSGKEIEIRSLKFAERAPIKDEIERRMIEISEKVSDPNKAMVLALSIELSGKIVLLGSPLKESDLDDMDDFEIREIASSILNLSYIKSDVKKK